MKTFPFFGITGLAAMIASAAVAATPASSDLPQTPAQTAATRAIQGTPCRPAGVLGTNAKTGSVLACINGAWQSFSSDGKVLADPAIASSLVIDKVSVGIFQLSAGAKTLVHQSTAELVANNVATSLPGISDNRGSGVAITATASINQVQANVEFSWRGAGTWFTHGRLHTVRAAITVPVNQDQIDTIRHFGRTYEIEVKATKA